MKNSNTVHDLMNDTPEAIDGEELTFVDDHRLPITVIFGPSGSGKSAIISHMLTQTGELSIGVLSHNQGELPVGWKSNLGSITHHPLAQGCLCCEGKEELQSQLHSIVKSESSDYLIIEAGPYVEPLSLMTAFMETGSEEGALGHHARIDTMVAVVDASTFHELAIAQEEMDEDEALEQLLLEEEGEEEDRANASLPPVGAPTPFAALIEQIENADVVVLHKCDLVSAEALETLTQLMRVLAPSAKIISATHGAVPLEEIMFTGRFSFEEEEDAPETEQTPEAPSPEIVNFVFQASRPFDTAQFMDFVSSEWAGVLRSRGCLWLTSDPTVGYLWSQAGSSAQVMPLGKWSESDSTQEVQGDNKIAHQCTSACNHSLEEEEATLGEPRQEIEIIGMGIDPVAISAGLEACLVSEEML